MREPLVPDNYNELGEYKGRDRREGFHHGITGDCMLEWDYPICDF